jgi:ATP-dependent RNA helicase DOB1
LKKAEKERDAIKVDREDEIKEYYELRQLLKEKGQDFQAVISHPTYSLPFLNPGRLIEVKDGDADFGWGVVVGYNKIINPKVCPLSHFVPTTLFFQSKRKGATQYD